MDTKEELFSKLDGVIEMVQSINDRLAKLETPSKVEEEKPSDETPNEAREEEATDDVAEEANEEAEVDEELVDELDKLLKE